VSHAAHVWKSTIREKLRDLRRGIEWDGRLFDRMGDTTGSVPLPNALLPHRGRYASRRVARQPTDLRSRMDCRQRLLSALAALLVGLVAILVAQA
jgi:hypothetical protein